jgi:hypothetical protein
MPATGDHQLSPQKGFFAASWSNAMTPRYLINLVAH